MLNRNLCSTEIYWGRVFMSSRAFAADLFQENEAYQHAEILLYDTIAGSRQATRSILFNLGFRNIQTISKLGEFKEELDGGAHDLVIADLTDQVDEVSHLVSRVRRGDIGANPFVVVILTSFELSALGLESALSSGADDLLMRPLSTGQIQRRIRALVEVRKDFVVTSDYIGPDRRTDPERPTKAELVEVPNSLRACVEEGPVSARETANQIAEMREKVAEEHLLRLSVRMGVEAHRFSHAEQGSDDALRSRIVIEDTASDIGSRIGPTRGQASSLTKMLLNVLAGTQKVDPDRQQELIYHLALGVGVALRGDGDEAAMEAEVESTVETLNARPGMADENDVAPGMEDCVEGSSAA